MADASSEFNFPSNIELKAGTHRSPPNFGGLNGNEDGGTVVSSKIYLPPVFENIPAELKQCDRWVTWFGAKRPRDAKLPNKAAKSNDPRTWATYSQALAAYEGGGYQGIGFVLNGDGIVGVDIDNCVVDGKPSAQALAVMESIGCQYVELSPSGNGLRGFGFVDNPPPKAAIGMFKGIKVELYSTSRYLTVTGHTLNAGPIAQLPGYLDAVNQIRSSRMTEDTDDIEGKEETEGTDLSSSFSSAEFTAAYKFTSKSIPKREGERSRALFLLARDLRGKFWDADPNLFKPLIQRWHQQMLPVIGTKAFRTSWTDFCAAWAEVKYPEGKLSKVISGIDAYPIDNPGKDFSEGGDKLYQLCIALQAEDLSEPFFLGCRQAGAYLGTSHDYAARLLKAFVGAKILELAVPSTAPTRDEKGKVNRYRVPPKHSVRA